MMDYYNNQTKSGHRGHSVHSLIRSCIIILGIIVLCMTLIESSYAKDEKTVKLQDTPKENAGTIAEKIQDDNLLF